MPQEHVFIRMIYNFRLSIHSMQGNENDIFMKPICEPYQNDAKTPAFSHNHKAYTWQMLVKILIEEHEKEAHCVATPVNIAHNVSFLVHNSSLKHWSDVKCDDMGAWINTGCPKLYFSLQEKEEETTASIHKCEKSDVINDDKFCILQRSYYVNASSKDCHKVISTLQGNSCSYLACVQTMVTGEKRKERN